ncbi:MAG: hypothetical protein M1823_002274 [Watsoniomyces obsoletus]|nr:MAG: hypothetical protein M1823_002274 [Watsoniomyces obsoletus]
MSVETSQNNVFTMNQIHNDTSTTQINMWLEHIASRSKAECRIFPKMVAFFSQSNKENYLAVGLPEEIPNYQHCATITHLPGRLVNSGSAALITSDVLNVVEVSADVTNQVSSVWHAAVVYKKKRTLYIFDPAFDPCTVPGYRLREISGLSNVRRLVQLLDHQKKRIDMIKITGRNDKESTCLRLSCGWLKELAEGKLDVSKEEWYELRR